MLEENELRKPSGAGMIVPLSGKLLSGSRVPSPSVSKSLLEQVH
jgi:hypothetical protein